MSKIALLLQAEMTRLAAKQVKTLNKDVAVLKREVARLNKKIAAMAKAEPAGKGGLPTPVAIEVPEGGEVAMRLSPGLIKKLRNRLQVSQVELAQLVGVSQPAVASWEQGRAKPRGAARAAIGALRSLSAAQARQKLGGSEGKPRPRRGRKPKTMV